MIKRLVWKGRKKSTWPNGCSAPFIVKSKAKFLALPAEGASPGEVNNMRSECSTHDMTGASHVTLKRTQRGLKIHYKTYQRGDMTGFTDIPAPQRRL